jgi:16S rRNA (cytidine1402-2'-O)-methyltransferase
VSRELTKIFEENVRGTVAEVLAHFKQTPPKGELVVVIEGLGAISKGISKVSPTRITPSV